MIRFALTITAIEIALTLAGSTWIAFAETGDPGMAEGDFAALGIDIERYSANRRTRFGSAFSYDTEAVVKGRGPAITVSLRVHTPRAEYDSRLSGESWPKLREGDERPTVTAEPMPGEPGYTVRQRGRDGVRVEGVRLRGDDLLIVRAIWLNAPDAHAGQQVAKCERLVRILQDHMMVKLRWRDAEGEVTSR